MTCPEIDPALDEQRGALQLSQHITTCLNALKAAALPNVTIIFIPTRWARWRTFETEQERFNPHNFVKAYLSSVPQQNGTLKVDGYPVKRGTLKLDRDSALLWVHGVSRAINPRFKLLSGQAPYSSTASHPPSFRPLD